MVINSIQIQNSNTVIVIPTEAVPGHIIETADITIGVLHDAFTPVHIIPTMTPHITDCLHTGVYQLTLETTADHNAVQHTNQVRKPCIILHPIPAELQAIHMIKEIQESQQMIHKWTSAVQMITLVILKMIKTMSTKGALPQ